MNGTTMPRDDAPPVRRGLRRWWPRVRLAISLALLLLVFSRLDVGRAAQVLTAARLELIVLVVLVGYAGRFFAALRWYILIRAMGSDAPYLSLVRLTYIGMFLQFMPAGSIALEVGRVYGLSRTTDDLAGSFASVLLERIFGLAALVIVALVGLAFAPPGVPPVLTDLAWVGFAVIAFAAWAIMSRRVRTVLDRLLERAGLDPVRSRLGKLYARLDATRHRPALLAWSLVAALFNTLFRIVPAWLLAVSLGIGVSLPQLFVIVPIIYLGAQIPISVAGLGVREVGWVALLGLIGVPASDAIVLSLLLVAVVFLVALPGAWLWARHGLHDPRVSGTEVAGTAAPGTGREPRPGA